MISGPVYVPFGTWLKEQRRKAGITRDALADQAACSSITLQKIEARERRPSRQIALSLAELFQIPADEHEAFVTFARTLSPKPPVPTSPTSPAAPTQASRGAPQVETEADEQEQAYGASPWRAVHLSKSNLPMVLTTLIGRERELSEVCSRLRQPKVRLLTLAGSPGTGKTRMAIEVASALLDDFEDGVYLVELAPLSDPAMVMPSIARTLDLPETRGRTIEESLLAQIKDKRILLVLDNFEHLLDAGPQVVKLIQASPWIKVLITSREALHVRGERQYPLPPLSLPQLTGRDSKGRPSLEELARNPSVQLFVERAEEADTDFSLTEENAQEVAEVCVNLDGLPLAIELAAGRVSLFPPRMLLSRLGQRLKVLTGGSRDLPVRQRTLRGAIEWSYDLLDEGHQELFRRMAVFSGGRTLDGLEAVCNSAGLQVEGKRLKVEVVDGVETLLSSNLLQQREGRDGEPRFWMLVTIYDYALEKLEESGEAAALQKEHALYFMRLAERAEPYITGKEQQDWLNRLEDEYDNLRAAMSWCGEQGQLGSPEAADIGLRTAGALWRFWYVRSLLTEGREQLDRVLSLPEAVLQACSPTSKVKVLHGAASLTWRQGDYSSARSLLERALVLGREGGDKQSLSFSLNTLGLVAVEQGDYSEARALYEESLALRREIGDTWGIAVSLGNIGLVMHEQGDYSEVHVMLEESLALRREIGDTWGIAVSLFNLGLVTSSQGDYTGGRAMLEESMTLLRELGDKSGVALLLNNLGLVTSSQGDYTGAHTLYEESLALQQEVGDKRGKAESLAGLGIVAAGMGQMERGARLLGAGQGLLQNMGAVLARSDRVPYERAVASAHSALGEEAFEKAWQEGRGMSLEEAVDYALGKTSIPSQNLVNIRQ